MESNQSKKLRRADASEYLLEQHHISYKPSTLAKLAVTGGGPKFYHAGRIPLYPTMELDIWAQSMLSPLKSSTSDRGNFDAIDFHDPLHRGLP